MRVHHQAAFVLLNRPYSETSWIVELFTREYGRVAVMAKGARRLKSRLKGVLLPFQPILVSWSGKGEVPTLTAAEIQLGQINLFDQELQGDALICGFYCNELISYLLHRHDPHPALFDVYSSTVTNLHHFIGKETDLSLQLRRFEQAVIRETGYAIDFTSEANSKSPIRAEGSYVYQPREGFVPCTVEHPKAVSGRIVLSLQESPETTLSLGLSAAEISLGKHLMRAILSQSLGYKKINSRELFVRDLKRT